jgi:transcriptional regulator with XRE-family HTH domain
MRKCEICHERVRAVAQPFDYTALAGLDPKTHTVLLCGIEIEACKCGPTPIIPNVDGLHIALACALLESESPFDGSVFRFLRKTLGMTQQLFAGLANVTAVTVSNWERGFLPESTGEVAVRALVLAQLVTREDLRPHMTQAKAERILIAIRDRAEAVTEKLKVSLQYSPDDAPIWRSHPGECEGVGAH